MAAVKLFDVEACIRLIVVARSEREAERIATDNLVDELDGAHVLASEVSSIDNVDPEWKDALPYGAHDERTVREWVSWPACRGRTEL